MIASLLFQMLIFDIIAFSFKDLFITYFKEREERERERAHEGQRERERERERIPSRLPLSVGSNVGLNLTTLRSRPELKSEV